MLKSALASLVAFCTRHAWTVIAAATLLSLVSGIYVTRHFAIDTDIGKLISPDLPWRQRELAYLQAFPQRIGTIFAVVDAPTSELASQASAALVEQLSRRRDVFQSVEEPGASSLFRRDGLMFLATDEVERVTAR